MPVKVSWEDDAKRIMRYTIEGNWTWDEFYPEYHRALALEKAVFHRVDVIVDISNTGRLPMNILAHVRTFADEMPPNVELVVVVVITVLMVLKPF